MRENKVLRAVMSNQQSGTHERKLKRREPLLQIADEAFLLIVAQMRITADHLNLAQNERPLGSGISWRPA